MVTRGASLGAIPRLFIFLLSVGDEYLGPAYIVLMLEKGLSCEKSRKASVNVGNQRIRNRGRKHKPGTGTSLHTQEPVTVASFRTWRGWRECVARDRCLTCSILASQSYSSFFRRNRQQCTKFIDLRMTSME